MPFLHVVSHDDKFDLTVRGIVILMGGNESLLRYLEKKIRNLEEQVRLHEKKEICSENINRKLEEQVSFFEKKSKNLEAIVRLYEKKESAFEELVSFHERRARMLEKMASSKISMLLGERKKLQSEESNENIIVADIGDREIPIYTRDFLERFPDLELSETVLETDKKYFVIKDREYPIFTREFLEEFSDVLRPPPP